MKTSKKMNKIILAAITLSMGVGSVMASSRYLSGGGPTENQELNNNMNNQGVQTNEQLTSGHMNPAQASVLTQEQSNLNIQQRGLESQSGIASAGVNPPPNIFNPAQEEQINIQEQGIDTQLSNNTRPLPPAVNPSTSLPISNSMTTTNTAPITPMPTHP